MAKLDVFIRQHSKEDLPFIFNSWLKDYKQSEFAKNIADKVYYQFHHLVIEGILERPTTEVYVACDPQDHSVIYGWVCTENKNIIHYAYLKSSFRNLGIFKELVRISLGDVKILTYTHFTTSFYKHFITKRVKDLTLQYIPYLI